MKEGKEEHLSDIQTPNQTAANKSFTSGLILGAIGGFFIASVLYGGFFVLYTLSNTSSDSAELEDNYPSEEFTERTSYNVNYSLGYDDGYADGSGDYSEYGDSYYELSSTDSAEAYHDGYLNGFFDGCYDAGWDCEYLNDAIRSGFVGVPSSDVLHAFPIDLTTPFDPPSQSLRSFSYSADVYDARSSAVVTIYDGYFGFVGSGVIIDPSGLVVTNHHVLRGLEDPYVQLSDGTIHELRAMHSHNEYRDLAIFWLETEQEFPFVPIRGSEEVRIGEEVVVIGSPEGYTNTLSTGELSGRREEGSLTYLQTNAPITYGSSGGAMLDLETGSLIGIITSGYDLGNLNFAVPSEDISEMLAQ